MVCIYANINSYLIICKSPLDWSIFIGEQKKHMTGKRPDCSNLITQELNIPLDFIHFHLFHAFTHQATPNVYLWPRGVEVKLFAKDYPKKRTAFTRLQSKRHSARSPTLQSKTMKEHPAILRILGVCAHIEGMNGCKLICDTIFLTKTRKDT